MEKKKLVKYLFMINLPNKVTSVTLTATSSLNSIYNVIRQYEEKYGQVYISQIIKLEDENENKPNT